MAKGKECECGAKGVLWWIVQASAWGIAVYFIVAGIRIPWNREFGISWLPAVIYGAIGFFLWGFGKWCKWKSHQGCPAHEY